MQVKATMRPLDRGRLSEHEAKRCRALARGLYWQVLEEHVTWWSPDDQSWLPLVDELLPRRRRFLVLETEQGYELAHIWEVGDDFELPPPSQPQDAGLRAGLIRDDRYA